MVERGSRFGAIRASEIVFGLVLAALIVVATLLMFSTFMAYDDEGYVLLSLKNYAESGGLYRELYSQYGPFPFVAHQVFHALGLPFTHTAGRLLTLALWAGTAVACAALVQNLTRNLGLRLWVLTATFCHLWIMPSEPTHPGGWIVLLTTLLAVCGCRWLQRGEIRTWSLFAGAIVGLLLLTKINIGIFAAFAVGGWWLLHHENEFFRRWAPVLVGAASILMPFALMRPLLATPWVSTFAFVFAFGAAAVVATVALTAEARTDGKTLGTGALAAGGAMAIIAVATCLRGTRPEDLLEGIVLGPLRHPISFSLRHTWPSGILVAAAVSFVACVGCVVLRRRGSAITDVFVAALRIAATLALAFNVSRYPYINPNHQVLDWTLPCLWFFAWPLSHETRDAIAARAFVVLVLLGQILHAYPVPGSQVAWGTVLVLPLAAAGAWEGLVVLQRGVSMRKVRVLRAAGLAAAVFATVVTGWSLATTSARYRDGEYLGLPGAEAITVPAAAAARLRVLAVNASAHANRLFALPGMFSFNLWTNLPTPTRANVTHWFSLLDENRQQEIIRALAADPRACVIVDHTHIKFLADRALAPKGPLYDYVMESFVPVLAADEVEFRVHRGRTVEPFLIGELFTLSAGSETPRNAESSLLQISLFAPLVRPAASLVIATRRGTILLNAENTRLEIMPLTARGEPLGPPQPAAWPLTTSAPARVLFYFHGERQPPLPPGAVIKLLDTAGGEVGLARMKL